MGRLPAAAHAPRDQPQGTGLQVRRCARSVRGAAAAKPRVDLGSEPPDVPLCSPRCWESAGPSPTAPRPPVLPAGCTANRRSVPAAGFRATDLACVLRLACALHGGRRVQLGGPLLRQGELLQSSHPLVASNQCVMALATELVVASVLTDVQVGGGRLGSASSVHSSAGFQEALAPSQPALRTFSLPATMRRRASAPARHCAARRQSSVRRVQSGRREQASVRGRSSLAAALPARMRFAHSARLRPPLLPPSVQAQLLLFASWPHFPDVVAVCGAAASLIQLCAAAATTAADADGDGHASTAPPAHDGAAAPEPPPTAAAAEQQQAHWNRPLQERAPAGGGDGGAEVRRL